MKKGKYTVKAQNGLDNTNPYDPQNLMWNNAPNIKGNQLDNNPMRFKRDKDGNLVDTLTGKVFYQTDPNQQSPITLPPNDSFDITKTTTRTGDYDLSRPVKIANTLVDLTTGIANISNNGKTRRAEQRKYIESIQPRAYENTDEDGLNQNNIYYKHGGEPSPEKAREMLHNPPNGKITEKQRKYFAYLASKAQNGALLNNYPGLLRDLNNDGRFDLSETNNLKPATREFLDRQGKIMGQSYNDPNLDYWQNGDGGLIINKKGQPIQNSILSPIQQNTNKIQNNILSTKEPDGNPVYGPSNALIGYSNNGIFSPTLMRDHFGKVNKPDSDLLNNLTELFKYITKKGLKYQIGGSANNSILAEAGEVYKDTNGDINKIPDNEDTHDDKSGGVVLNDAHRILEDTGDKRNDIDSKLLRITPTEMLEMGIKVNKPVTHSKAFELVSNKADKDLNYVKRYLKKNATSLDDNPNDQYAKNSLDLNTNAINTIPTKNDIFEMLFNHQEQKKAMYGISNDGKAQVGGENDDTDYTAQINYLRQQASRQALGNPTDDPTVDYDKEYNRVLQYASQAALGNLPQQPTANYLGQNPAQSYIPQQTASSTNPYSGNQRLYNSADGKTYTRGELQKWQLSNAEIDNAVKKGDFTTTQRFQIPGHISNVNITPGEQSEDPASTAVNTLNQGDNKFTTKTNSNGFNSPLRWYDTLPATTAFIDALSRKGVNYDGIDLTAPKTKYLNPEPALQQGQEAFNSTLDTLPQNGLGYANAANVFGKKYAMDTQTIGQYQNLNNGIWNQNQAAISATRNAQAQSDQQSRQLFETKQLQGMEAQRQQLLRSMSDISTTVAQHAKFEREGNLLLKLFPAFGATGDYNGYKYNFYTPNGKQVMDYQTQLKLAQEKAKKSRK